MASKILVVEDEETMRSILEESLTEKGYSVDTAADGDSGMDLSLKNEYDLILLDIILPKKNGLEILEAVKKDRKGKLPKVLVLTNLGEADYVQKALDLGATSYLVKADHNLQDIMEKVSSLLEK